MAVAVDLVWHFSQTSARCGLPRATGCVNVDFHEARV